jgi:hypothetical protein
MPQSQEYKIKEVDRDGKKIISVTVTYCGHDYVFIKNGADKIVRQRTPGEKILSIPKNIFLQIHRQVYAIFRKSQNQEAKKSACQINELVMLAIGKQRDDADFIQAQISDYHAKRPRSSWTKAMQAVLKNMPRQKLLLDRLDNDRIWIDFLSDSGVVVLKEGWLSVSRWRPGKKKPVLARQIVPDIFTAIRMQRHILDQYKVGNERQPGELARLETIENIIARANDLLINWQAAETADKTAIQIEIAKVILSLEKSRNPSKLEAKRQAEKTLPLKDSLERENPGALAARTVAIINQLAKRLEQLGIIMPIIAMRQEILVFEARRQEQLIASALPYTQLVLRHAVFRTEKIREEEKEYLSKKINQSLHFLDRAYIEPFWGLAQRVKFYLELSKLQLAHDQFSLAKISLENALENMSVKLEN